MTTLENPSDNKIHHLDMSLKRLNIMFAWKGKNWKCLRSTSTCATLTKRWAVMFNPLVHNDQQIFVKEDVERFVILKWVRTKRRSGWGAESGRLFRTSSSSHPTKTGLIEDPWLECEIWGSLVSRVKVSLVTQWQFSSTGVNGQAWFEKCGRKQRKSRGIILSNRYLAFSPWL